MTDVDISIVTCHRQASLRDLERTGSCLWSWGRCDMEPLASPASGAQAPSRMSDGTVSSSKAGALFLHVSPSPQPPALSLGVGWGGVGSSSEEETATPMPWEAVHLTISLGEAGTEWGRHAGGMHLSVNFKATQEEPRGSHGQACGA